MFITDSLSGDLIILFMTISAILISYRNKFHQHWQRKNIPLLESYISNSKEHLGLQFKRLYDVVKEKGWKHGGLYSQLSRVYVVGDLDYIKNIMAKEFQYFPHRGLYYNETGDPLSAHIFNTSGTKWRNMRSQLGPIFTAGKIKMMLPILLDCEKLPVKKLEKYCDSKEPIDIKEAVEDFVTNVIATCVFGLDCKNFDTEVSMFKDFGRKIFKRSRSRRIKGLIVNNFPKFAQILNIALIPKDVSAFFMKTVKDTIAYRKQNKIIRHDFIQVLIDLNNNKVSEEPSLTVEEIAAQCFIFYIAGVSTSPTAMTFTLYELAKNQEIQQKVRDEIELILLKHGDKITYDSIQELKYLDQVFDEALRKYPPAAYLNRKCIKDYKIPNTDIVIEEGTTVVIPVMGIHYDEDYYPDPERFDPERFSEESKSSRPSYAYIPFGEGPRICIGMRFGLLQSKVGLVSLLKNFKFTVNERTKEPLKMKPGPLVLTAEGDIWLDAHKI